MARWIYGVADCFLVSLTLVTSSRWIFASAGETYRPPLPDLLLESQAEARLRQITWDYVWRSQIRCQGVIPYSSMTFPDIIIPDGYTPQQIYPSVHSLCTPAALGGNRNWNADLYCGWKLTPPTVIFNDIPPNLPGSPIYAFWSDVAVLCQLRCSCLRNVLDPHTAETTIPALEVRELIANPYSNIIRNPPRVFDSQVQANGQLIPVVIYILRMAMHNVPAPRLDTMLSLDLLPNLDADQLHCNGLLPPIALPEPFRDYQFESLQVLCAGIHDGGDRAGNMGGMCTSALGFITYASNQIHPGFLRPGDMRAIATQFWCTTHCRCGRKAPATQVKVSEAGQVARLWTPFFSNGGLILRATNADGTTTDRTYIRPDSDGTSSSGSEMQECSLASAGTCVDASYPTTEEISQLESFRMSPSPPIRIVRGPRRVKLVPFQRASVQSDRFSTLKSCGGTCSSFKDCASSLSESCRCVADISHEDARKYGLAALFTQSFCLPIALSAAALSSKRQRLGGRSLDLDVACACNSTYASRGCCDSVEGLVDGVETIKPTFLYDE